MTQSIQNQSQPTSKSKVKKKGIDPFKVISFILFLLLAGTLSYFLIFEERITIGQQPVIVQQLFDTTSSEGVLPQKSDSIRVLDPQPNSRLNDNDYRLIARKLKKNMKVEDVVKIIFKENPTEIEISYKDQIAAYSRQLVADNPNCFKDTNNTIVYIQDTLRNIPSFK